MDVTGLLDAAKRHARISFDDFDGELVLMLSAAAGDVSHAAAYALPASSLDLPDDLRFAIIDQATILFNTAGGVVERPAGLSLAASRIAARYRGVRVCLPPPPEAQ